MNRRKFVYAATIICLITMTLTGCGQGSKTGTQTGRSADWSAKTHSNKAAPDYDIVFPQDRVNEMEITISADSWKTMQSNMTELFGAQGTGQRAEMPNAGGLGPGNVLPPGGGNMPQQGNAVPPAQVPGGGMIPGGGMPNGGMPGGGADMTPENPVWVPATIEFNGLSWTNVGVRYKGNSSLMSGWRNGTLKLPLKLDFDEFEDEYPDIKNQRFYGFKQLSLSNAFNDGTYMRDVITSDILADTGLPVAETAYYNITIDYGEGPVDLGLYVMIEVVDDTVIDRVYGDDAGNIYEGDGAGVSLATGTINKIQSSFQKENNIEEADWSDIEALYKVLHSEERISAPEAWRANMEEVFDVDIFLEWLAISSVIQNWDTYGSMSHNFYLYHNPVSGQLEWISWDHNMVLGGNGMGGRGRGGPGGGTGNTASLSKDEVGDNWPLIRYLLDDPVYREQYINYIEKTINGAFTPDKIKEKCQKLTELIATYAAKGSSTTTFESAVQQLNNRVSERYQAAIDFLTAQG